MNTNDYAQLAKHTAQWAQGIRDGQAVYVADALERVSAYCLERASVPDEWEKKLCNVNAAEQRKYGLTCPAPTWKWLQGVLLRKKRKTTA